MSTLTNVSSANLNATGVLYNGPTNLAGYQIAPNGTPGAILFRDGGASGPVLLEVDTTSSTVPVSTLIPGNGIRFTTNIHVTLPAGHSVTIFYG